MVENSEKVKDLLLKLKDENGNFMISDDMPEDIKSTLLFLNESGIDIYANQPIDDFDDDDDDDSVSDSTYASDELSTNSSQSTVSTSSVFVEDDSSIEDLDDLF